MIRFKGYQDYISYFKDDIRKVSGRENVEEIVKKDISRLSGILLSVNCSITKRDDEISLLLSQINEIKNDNNSYIINYFIYIYKPIAVRKIKSIEIDVNNLKHRRGKLFDREMQLDECKKRLEELLRAAHDVKSSITIYREAHAQRLRISSEKRAEKKLKKDALLSRYKNRIALGDAYVGKTRQVAAQIKKALIKSEECPYCGLSMGRGSVADHIYPVSRGGLSSPENLVYVCEPCNQRKSDYPLTEFAHRNNLDILKIHQRLIKLNKRF